MKYVIYAEWKGPIDETMKKSTEIENERKIRGETFSQTGELIEQYVFLEGMKGFFLVEIEDLSSIFKWTRAYGDLLKKVKIKPVLTRKEWEEINK